ncbi:hypothetical protein DS745_04210 [Anaerobacillus alkaliphilus]|uniref:DUF4309 domain-containing protein n=1 Tax=Anaerobacillus alkaliphilus TaxID=1548597 RepID=A0A4Q0VY08_9BACI|nr:hypothetical protein [Anaerobacillus alkaliphilus]RXJ04594.1 hypothetical protein DS745_04210 [Anaerobacillus alkaliphilus]
MLKKVFVCSLVFLVLGSSFLFFKHNFSRSFHHRFTQSTDLSYENINGTSLLEKIDLPKAKSRDNDLYHYFHLEEGIEVAANSDGEIVRFIITGETKTVRGVGVGDTIEKITATYGKNYYRRSEHGINILGYKDHTLNHSIEFWHDQNNTVLFFRYDLGSME